MRNKRNRRYETPNPENLILAVTIFYILTSSVRGYIRFRQNRLDGMYGEFDSVGINTSVDFTDFINSYF